LLIILPPQSNSNLSTIFGADIKAVRKADTPCETSGISIDQLANLARRAGFKGIGFYDKHLHVDIRVDPASWGGKSK